MIYQIVWDKQSKDFLKKMNNKDAQRIINKVNGVTENPRRYVETLVEVGAYKLRVGDYRAIIDIEENNKILKVLFIGHRKNIYKYLMKKKDFKD